MEKKKFWVPVITGVAGLLIGVGLTLIVIHLYRENYAIVEPACPPTLTKQQADSYRNKYLSTAKPFTAIIKGFNVNAQEMNAWNCLLKNNSQLGSFRAYKGMDEKGDSLLIVVGVNTAGKDDTTLYYRAVPLNGGPCPPICDKN
jgi:hypothetical protein